MAGTPSNTPTVEPSSSLVTLTHVLYAMHGFSALMGLLSPVLIVTAFLSGWPSIIAVIINFVKRNDVRSTYLDSHFSWQVRTFFYALLWVVVMMLCFMTLILIPVAWALAVGVGIWILYRIVRGWLALLDRKPISV
ncbi:MAG TPA: hypothetical protein VD867_15470 [Burkholderiales bacterium]|nr:hypothetical protein [Burkholderiales bacterium]